MTITKSRYFFLGLAALVAMAAFGAYDLTFGSLRAHADGVPPPSCHIWITNPTIQAGQDFIFNWDCQNATNGWSNELGVNFDGPQGSITVSGADHSMTISATFDGPGGQTTCFTELIVTNPPPPPAPTCTLTASPTSIVNGSAATLTWSAQNATNGTLDQGIGGINPNSGSVRVTPTQTTTYTATFTGSGGSVNCQATVTVTTPPSAPTCTISLSSPSIQKGQSTILFWSSQNATSFTISGIGSVNLSGSMTAFPPQTQTYVGTVTGAGGTATCQATVTVTQPNAPTCTLSVTPQIVRGDSARLSWTANNATSGSIDNGIGSINGFSGSVTVSPTQTTTYTATFTGPGGTVNCSATIVVSQPNAPTCTLSVNPASIQTGQSTTLSWNSQNATSFTISGIGSVNLSGSMTAFPPQTQTYVGTVTGTGGTATCQATVTVNQPQAPTCTLTANPQTIVSGQSATLSWTSQNATSGSISGIGSVGPSGSQSVTPSQTTTYMGTFTGPGGTVNCSATVTVTQPNAPTCTLTANPQTIDQGNSATLSWTSQNATSAFLTGRVGMLAPSGSTQVNPSHTTTFSLTVTGPGGTADCQATVTVTQPSAPTCTLSVNPASIQTGQSTTLSWSSQNATSFTISGIGSVNLSGSMNAFPPQTQTYVGTVTGPGGTATCQATVTVNNPPPAPTCTLSVSPATIQQGQSTTLSWSSLNASGGSISGIGSVGPSGSQSVTPSQTTTYNGTFTGQGGTANCQTTVTVTALPPPPAPVCTLVASPVTIQSGQSTTLTWTSQNATSGSINNSVGSVNMNGSTTVSPTQSTIYIATFTGSGGTVTCQATVTVNALPPPPSPTCVINASPTTITQQGQNITLNWTAENATVGSITNIGSVGPSGSQMVTPTQSGAYTATFTGPGGTVNCTVNIQIIINNPPPPNAPTCTLTVSPATIQQGQSATITWSSTNATNGNITNIGSVGTSGSQTVYPNQSTSYTGTFTGSGGSANCYGSVNVNNNNNTYPQCSLTADTSVVNPGQGVNLHWNSQNANYGTITNIGSVSTNGSQMVYPYQSQVYEGTFSGSGGSVNCFVTVNVNQVYVPPPQQPPYVQLSQAPYTGLDLGPWGTTLYWAFLVAWCALAAYLVGVKKIQNKLFDYVMQGYYGTTRLAPKGMGFVDAKPVYAEHGNGSTHAPMGFVQATSSNDATDSFVMAQITR